MKRFPFLVVKTIRDVHLLQSLEKYQRKLVQFTLRMWDCVVEHSVKILKWFSQFPIANLAKERIPISSSYDKQKFVNIPVSKKYKRKDVQVTLCYFSQPMSICGHVVICCILQKASMIFVKT